VKGGCGGSLIRRERIVVLLDNYSDVEAGLGDRRGLLPSGQERAKGSPDSGYGKGREMEASSALEHAPPAMSAPAQADKPVQTAEPRIWHIAILFCGSVLALYAAAGYAIHVLIAAVA
jgi:hypothetical protein